MSNHQKFYIDGEWVDAASGKTFEVGNPATATTLTEVAEADAADVDRAVASARQAFDSGAWPGLAPRKRARVLWEMARLLEERKDEVARVETLQNGKPLFESGIDVDMTAETFEYYAGWATKIEGETIPVSARDVLCYTVREPVGDRAGVARFDVGGADPVAGLAGGRLDRGDAERESRQPTMTSRAEGALDL